MTSRSMIIATCIAGSVAWCVVAADPDTVADYERVIAARADKVVASLDPVSMEARDRVRDGLLKFFRSVNAWHDQHAARRRELRSMDDGAAREELTQLEDDLRAIRRQLIDGLSEDLSPEQIETVKDGLTYNVLHVTERAYHDMIERLTPEQKAMIHDHLVEARELAISEGSSEAKHAVFGKFKGRINNELSRQGYDLKQEERGWQARRKAAAEASTTTEEPK